MLSSCSFIQNQKAGVTLQGHSGQKTSFSGGSINGGCSWILHQDMADVGIYSQAERTCYFDRVAPRWKEGDVLDHSS
jgi:hypothetical protein